MIIFKYTLGYNKRRKRFCPYTLMRIGTPSCLSCRHFSHKNFSKKEVYCEGDEMYDKNRFYKLLLTEKREETVFL